MTQPLQPGPRDPRQPFGRPEPAPVSTADYATPRTRRPLWVRLGVLVLLGLVLALAFRMGRPQGDASAPAASDPASTAVAASPAPPTGTAPSGGQTPRVGVLRSVPFSNPADGTSGTFEVLGHQWTDRGLAVTLRVRLDQGQQRLGFFALDNGPTASQYRPTPSGPEDLDGRSISAGQQLSGTVLFAKPHGSTTVFLSSSGGKQVAALKVED